MPSFRVNQPPSKPTRSPKTSEKSSPPVYEERIPTRRSKKTKTNAEIEVIAEQKPVQTFRVDTTKSNRPTKATTRASTAPRESKTGNKRLPGKLARILVILTLVSVLGVAIFAYFRFNSFKESAFGGRDAQSLVETAPDGGLNAPTPDFTNSALVHKIQNGERFSILILGYGGPGHDGPFLTDTIMQVVYDPTKKTVSLINIPRDLFVLVPFLGEGKGGWTKINQAFSIVMNLADSKSLDKRYAFQNNSQSSKIDAAAILAKDTVEQVTGIPVDYWLTVNFEGFVRLIDAIGGVTVNVEKAFDDYNYSNNPGVNDGRNYLHFDAGTQVLSGTRAIHFVRSRYSQQEQGDISRSRRQMKIIQAVKEQVLKPDILLKVPGMLDALQGNLRTSVAFDEVIALAHYLNSAEGKTVANELIFNNLVVGMEFLNNSSNPEAGFIFQPKAGQGNYSEIKKWLQTSLDAAPPTAAPLTPLATPSAAAG